MATYATTPLADQTATDFNGDGTSDILWHNTSGDTSVWYNASTGGFTPSDLGVVDPSWTPVATGDFNNSGKAGILWRNSNGEVGEWLNSGGVGPASFTKLDLGNVTTDWVIQGTGDFNGDGTSDILWRNTNTTSADTAVWYTNAAGGYTPADLGVVDPSWSIQGIGDFSATNKSGILWRNTNGEVGLWQNTGGVGPAQFTKLDLGNVSTDWVIQGVGDFNGDGTSDVLWRNTSTNDTSLWFVSSNGSYTPNDLGVVDPSWKIVGVGDYNASGKAGILWQNTNGDVGEWLNTSPAGPGFTGFNKIVVTNVSPTSGWNVVSDTPPSVTPAATASPMAMAHAMSAMAAHSSGPALSSAVTPPSTTSLHPMLAGPGLATA